MGSKRFSPEGREFVRRRLVGPFSFDQNAALIRLRFVGKMLDAALTSSGRVMDAAVIFMAIRTSGFGFGGLAGALV
jgi:hypothetical protein